MTQTLKYYGIHLKHVPLLCENESAIKIQSRTIHIDARPISLVTMYQKATMILAMFEPTNN